MWGDGEGLRHPEAFRNTDALTFPETIPELMLVRTPFPAQRRTRHFRTDMHREVSVWRSCLHRPRWPTGARGQYDYDA